MIVECAFLRDFADETNGDDVEMMYGPESYFLDKVATCFNFRGDKVAQGEKVAQREKSSPYGIHKVNFLVACRLKCR